MNRRPFQKWVSIVVLVALGLPQSVAHAYGHFTHQSVVNEAWHVMRAGVAPNLVSQIDWEGSAPADAAPLDTVGDCALPASDSKNLCGRTVTQAEWNAFIATIKTNRQRLNKLRHEIPLVNDSQSCGGLAFSYGFDGTVGRFGVPISQNHLNTDDGSCATHSSGTPPGIFSTLTPGGFLPDDWEKTQGLVFGWHAEHRDDDHGDTWVDMMPILVGQILNEAGKVWETVVAVILAPFVCAYTWITGGSDCGSKTRKLADQTNPADVLKGILPGWKNKDASDEGVGFWHFINVQPGTSNWYDDTQGLFYEEAGPAFEPSGIDQSIMLAGDLLFLNLDASESAGCSRYEITEDETSFSRPSDDRANWSWQSETIGHTQYSPLDNFALYGHMRLQSQISDGKFGISGMGWPLHAIGDATVPMHVVGTSGWGHRPWEDFVNDTWAPLMFEKCSIHEPGSCTGGKPNNALKLDQLKQAKRVLQRGFRWYEFLLGHPDVRDFITAIAGETFGMVAGELVSNLFPFGSIWCDACSAGYADARSDGFFGTIKQASIDLYTDQGSKSAFDDPEGYYAKKARLFGLARTNLERSSAATLAYLLRVGDLAVDVCTPLGAACTDFHKCCGEDVTCTPQGICARNKGAKCNNTSECGQASCQNGRCCSGLITSGSCRVNDDCCGATCSSGTCCLLKGNACSRDEECCTGGRCRAGLCSNGGAGETCTTTGDCRSGACISGRCCEAGGGFCNTTGDCCSGTCTGNRCSAGQPGDACTTNGQCARGVCAPNGICCAPTGTSCSPTGPCCGSSTCNGTFCQGVPN